MQVGHSTLYSLSLSTKTRKGHILSSGRRSVKALTKLAISTIMLMPGCTPPFTHLFLPKPDPKIATPYEPPPVYAEWWAAAESCAHRHKTSTTGIGMQSNGPTLRSIIKDGSPG